jgi:hypothetical protein
MGRRTHWYKEGGKEGIKEGKKKERREEQSQGRTIEKGKKRHNCK